MDFLFNLAIEVWQKKKQNSSFFPRFLFTWINIFYISTISRLFKNETRSKLCHELLMKCQESERTRNKRLWFQITFSIFNFRNFWTFSNSYWYPWSYTTLSINSWHTTYETSSKCVVTMPLHYISFNMYLGQH